MRYIAIVPAAGSGSRMGGTLPKQYWPLHGRPLLWYAIETLARVERIDSVCVVLAPDDQEWARHDWSALGAKVRPLYVGGSTRAQSVTQALVALQDEVAPGDWVLVHDAARACLSSAHVTVLIDTLGDDAVGGLLAVPVADTMKRADAEGYVTDTVSREGMWQAQTPQMFRCGMLLEALRACPGVTDEAGAIEAMGLRPRLVAADATNFKVTYPHDFALAERLLATRAE
jgi:2-C-methyl-D-erythritol 4-phosphate cytidylyltransferase